jgi:hypothetical protein
VVRVVLEERPVARGDLALLEVFHLVREEIRRRVLFELERFEVAIELDDHRVEHVLAGIRRRLREEQR